MAKKPKTDPYLDDAQAQSIIRYGPETSALTALLRAAEQNYTERVRAARSAREFTVGAVGQAQPQVTRAYAGAQQAVQPAFAQGGGVEAQALQARLGEAQALAQQQLAARQVSAVEGEGSARQQALREFGQDRQKIGDRGTALAQEIGAFVTSTAGQSRSAAQAAQQQVDELNARLVQDERNSIRSSGTDPDTGLPTQDALTQIENAKPKPGTKWASQEQHVKAADSISSLQNFAQQLKSQKVSRADAAQALLAGQEAKEIPIYRTVKLPNGGTRQERVLNPDGTQKTRTIPAVPKAESQLLLKAALDMAYDGHLSRATQKLLHDRKMQIGQLGDLVTFGEWLKTPEGEEWRRRQRGGGTPGSSSPVAAVPGIGGAAPR
jgi:hypothetical protein